MNEVPYSTVVRKDVAVWGTRRAAQGVQEFPQRAGSGRRMAGKPTRSARCIGVVHREPS